MCLLNNIKSVQAAGLAEVHKRFSADKTMLAHAVIDAWHAEHDPNRVN